MDPSTADCGQKAKLVHVHWSFRDSRLPHCLFPFVLVSNGAIGLTILALLITPAVNLFVELFNDVLLKLITALFSWIVCNRRSSVPCHSRCSRKRITFTQLNRIVSLLETRSDTHTKETGKSSFFMQGRSEGRQTEMGKYRRIDRAMNSLETARCAYCCCF